MSQALTYSLISVGIISLVSFVGIVTIALKKKYLKSILLFLVSFAAGALLGDVFLHLLPELIHEHGFGVSTGLYVLTGILAFFILEKILHWRHCHLSGTEGHSHPLGTVNLVGGAFHNLIDGILVASSYALSIPVGIATTVAVILHEIPQEMGDFGVLLHSGMKTKKALLLNFASELLAFVGVFAVLGLAVNTEIVTTVLIPLTIGGFLYIANADLIPELHKDVNPRNSLVQLISFLLGVGIMWGLLLSPLHDLAHGGHDHDHGHAAEETHEEHEDEHHEEDGHDHE